jgi:hypothetical protein
MVGSERFGTFILVGLTSVFILLTIGLGINWLTGHDTQRSLILMILGGLLLCASLIWIRHSQGPRGEKRPADVSGAAVMIAKIRHVRYWPILLSVALLGVAESIFAHMCCNGGPTRESPRATQFKSNSTLRAGIPRSLGNGETAQRLANGCVNESSR